MSFLYREKDKIFYCYERTKKNRNAETVIFIHGNGLNHSAFDRIAPLFEEDYNVLRYDLRGFGQSDPGKLPLSWELAIGDLLFLVQSLNIPHFHLVGHGFGARLALNFALSHKGFPKSLVFLSMPPFVPDHLAEKAAQYRRLQPGPVSLQVLAEDLLKRMTLLPGNHPEIRKITAGYAQTPLSTFYHWLDLPLDTESLRLLNGTDIPALLLSGEQDLLFPPYLSGMSAYYLPVYRFLIVPGASNLMFLDQPEITADWIKRHFEKAERTPSPGGMPASAYDRLRRRVQSIIEEKEQNAGTFNELKVEVLHAFRVYVNGEEVTEGWNQRKAKQILIYLLFHNSATREQLCDILWPDVPFTISRSRLRVCLFHLNGLLKGDSDASRLILADHERIRLQGLISCDGTDFLEQVQQAVQEKNKEKRALCIRQLFQDFPKHLLHAAYEDWFLTFRERLENQMLELAEWMADQYLSSGVPGEAVFFLKTALTLRPGDERLCERLALCYRARLS